MGHLNKLHDLYAKDGLVIIAATNEPETAVRDFVNEHKATYPVMIEESSTYSSYGFTGAIPRAVLIGPAGRVLFKEHPNRLSLNDIEGHLESVRLLPEFPKELSSVKKALDKGAYAQAHKKATAALKKDDLKEPAQKTIEWVDWLAASSMEIAKEAAEGGDPYAAYSSYERIQDQFKGLPVAKQAKEAAAALKADKANKEELTAGKKLAALKKKLEKMSSKKARAAVKAFLKKYGKTKAGERARDLLKSEK